MLRHSKHVGKGLCARPSTGLRMTPLFLSFILSTLYAYAENEC